MEEQGAGFAPAFLRDYQPALFTIEGLARDRAFIAWSYPCFIVTNEFSHQMVIPLAIIPDVARTVIPNTSIDTYSPCKRIPLDTMRLDSLPEVVSDSLRKTSLDAMHFTHERSHF